LNIYTAAQPLRVDHPAILLVGPTDSGKTSLGHSMQAGVLVDCDGGVHRSVNRRDTAVPESWADVADPRRWLAGYDSVTVDTVQGALGLLTTALLEAGGHGTDGVLTPRGNGTRAVRFAQWLDTIRRLQKDVLLLAHAKEERDDRGWRVRPDISGSTGNELLKRVDFVGYLTKRNGRLFLDFSPPNAISKNLGNWPELAVPPADKAHTFMADLFDRARQTLADRDEAHLCIGAAVEAWREDIATWSTPAQYTDGLRRLLALKGTLPPAAYEHAHALLKRAARVAGLQWQGEAFVFVGKPAAPPTAPRVTARVATWQPALYSALTGTDGSR
jgi:AAA domain-containing protein